jgi:hypothetical protein
MPLHRASAKTLTLQRLLSRAIANATEEFVKPWSRMVGDAAQHIGEPSLRIDTVEFRRGDQGWSKPARTSPSTRWPLSQELSGAT